MSQVPQQRQHTDQKVADVLQLVVQHCPEASSIRTLCSLLQVGRTVQQSLQQALGHCRLAMPSITLHPNDICSTESLAACCSWLPKHIGLVTHLSFGDSAVHSKRHQPVLDTAQHLLALALRLCSAQAQAAAAVAAAAAHVSNITGARAQLALPPAAAAIATAVPWQLRSARLEWLVSPAIAQALSACAGLTRLDLALKPEAHKDTALFAALGSMQNLQDLKLYIADGRAQLDTAFAAGISQLTRLRRLDVGNYLSPAAAAALPSSLCHLTVILCSEEEQEQLEVFCMGQLRRLEDLELSINGVLSAASTLPPNVTRLRLEEGGLDAVAGLQALQDLHLSDVRASLPFLQQLSGLVSLRTIDVAVDFCDMRDGVVPGVPGELERVMAGIAGAPQLTKLVIIDRSASHSEDPHPSPMNLHGVKLHRFLKQLTSLHHLDIACLDVQTDDAVQFTALKSLTALKVYNSWNFGDVAAAAIACRLTNLRVLELIDCGLESPAIWPAVGMCTALESLCIDSAPNNMMVLDASILHLLTNLTRLTSLTGPEVHGMTAEAFDNFCAVSLPALVQKPDVY